jgi:uncharacterized protein (DUF302 family)
MSTSVYRAETDKSIEQFVADFIDLVKSKGFTIHNDGKMAMKDIFSAHGQEVADDFDLHMIQLCKPEKAAKSLSSNPERSVLMPKFIMVFSQDGKTQVRMLRYGGDLISELVEDADFPASLEETFTNLTKFIDAAV